jgi:hypothetical protein
MPGASCSRLTPPLRVSRFWTPSMKMECWQSLRLSGIGWKGSWIASISRTENDSVAVGVEGEGEQAGLLSALPTDEGDASAAGPACAAADVDAAAMDCRTRTADSLSARAKTPSCSSSAL